METLINFFALRPTFTLWGLKLLWYAYLLNTIVQVYFALFGLFQAFAQRGLTLAVWSPNVLVLVFGAVVQLALARLLLEVAAIIISNSSASQGSR